MKTLWLGQICIAVAAVVVMIPTARATTVTFTLDTSTATGNSCTSCGPFGTVAIASDGADQVKITETLASGVEFVSTGAGDALSFSISGDPSITIGSLTTGFAQGTGDSKGDTGVFDYGIDCTGCGSGGSSPEPGPLSFTVSTTGALIPSDFEVLSGKLFYLASDVIDYNVSGHKTGNVEASSFTTAVAPEPGTMVLFGTGLLVFAGMLRRVQKRSKAEELSSSLN